MLTTFLQHLTFFVYSPFVLLLCPIFSTVCHLLLFSDPSFMTMDRDFTETVIYLFYLFDSTGSPLGAVAIMP